METQQLSEMDLREFYPHVEFSPGGSQEACRVSTKFRQMLSCQGENSLTEDLGTKKRRYYLLMIKSVKSISLSASEQKHVMMNSAHVLSSGKCFEQS